jgi:hypothetical protein
MLFATRLVALLAGVQISGIANIADDLLVATGLMSARADDCSGDDHDAECPPGCPQCHCFHCGMSSLPVFAANDLPTPKAQQSAFWLMSDEAPRGPVLPSVYRPPRSGLAL